jgi:hypothetical protein
MASSIKALIIISASPSARVRPAGQRMFSQPGMQSQPGHARLSSPSHAGLDEPRQATGSAAAEAHSYAFLPAPRKPGGALSPSSFPNLPSLPSAHDRPQHSRFGETPNRQIRAPPGRLRLSSTSADIPSLRKRPSFSLRLQLRGFGLIICFSPSA